VERAKRAEGYWLAGFFGGGFGEVVWGEVVCGGLWSERRVSWFGGWGGVKIFSSFLSNDV